MHRHLVERNPFELHVASNADFAEGLLIHTQLRLPYPFQRLKKSRFGPALGHGSRIMKTWSGHWQRTGLGRGHSEISTGRDSDVGGN